MITNEQVRPVGSLLLNYICREVAFAYSEINQGYEAARSVALSARLKESARTYYPLEVSLKLLIGMERIRINTRVTSFGFNLYRFLNHSDCKVIDRVVRDSKEDVKTRGSGIEEIVALAQNAADEVNKNSGEKRPKIEIGSFPDWMYY